MDGADVLLRDRLFAARLKCALSHVRVLRERAVARRLVAELREVIAEAHRLRRRARWLRYTGKPLPKSVRK